MAFEIGPGITIGGGITLTIVSASAPPTPNTFTVATTTDGSGYTYYGASYYVTGYAGSSVNDFGTITSDSIYALYYKENISNNSYETIITLVDGSFTGYNVSTGAIDSDQLSYPRVFTIDGTDYTFNYIDNGIYLLYDDPIGLSNSVGSTLSLVYDPDNQITLTPNTIIVGYRLENSTPKYGASIYGSYLGTIVTSYFRYVLYDGTTTTIRLKPGSYSGFTVASDGTIDSDTTTARVFSIGGTTATLNVTGSMSYQYLVVGNPFGLNTKNGQTISAIYDPAAQGGGGSSGANEFIPQYTSDPGPNPWPTTADYSYVVYHDMYGMAIKGVKSSSDLYTFFTTASSGDSFDVVFSGTTYVITLGDFNPGSIYGESNGLTTFYLIPLSPGVFTASPSLSAGEGVTLYGTSITAPHASSGGSTVTITLSTSSYVTGYYYLGNPSFNINNNSGKFFMDTESNANALVSAAPTTLTFNDPYLNQVWTITGVSNLAYNTSGFGPGVYPVDLQWTGGSGTSPASSGIATLAYTTASGGGGGSSMTNIFFLNYAGNGHLIVLFANQADRDAASTLMSSPGTWSMVGDYWDGSATVRGTYNFVASGSPSTSDAGPPFAPYVLDVAGTTSNVTQTGSSQGPGGTYTATKV